MLKVILSFSDFQNEVLLIFRNKRLVWIFQIQNKLSSVNFLCKCISVNITFLIVFYVGTDAVDSIAITFLHMMQQLPSWPGHFGFHIAFDVLISWLNNYFFPIFICPSNIFTFTTTKMIFFLQKCILMCARKALLLQALSFSLLKCSFRITLLQELNEGCKLK